MTRISDLILSGVRDSAAALTASLRNSATSAGWNDRAADGLTVQFVGDHLTIRGDSQSDDAEYGGLENRPQPAVRKWVTDEGEITRLLLAAVQDKVKGALR